jgi:hypothetical protein
MNEPVTSPTGLRIRVGMDVYSSYQDQYIGSVIGIVQRGVESRGGPQSGGPNPSGSEESPDNVPLVHEEGASVGHTENSGKRMLGEEMGPVPTIGSGNRGPVNQSAGHRYATDERHTPAGDDSPGDVLCFAVRPGRLNLGPLTRPLYVPSSSVHSVSMERVVLAIQREGIPDGWRRRP